MSKQKYEEVNRILIYEYQCMRCQEKFRVCQAHGEDPHES